MNIKDLPVQYITNADGEKTAVVLPLETFQALLESIPDLEEGDDPDAGLSLRAALLARLARQQEAVQQGARGVSVQSVLYCLNNDLIQGGI